jgi:hypothetical protein
MSADAKVGPARLQSPEEVKTRHPKVLFALFLFGVVFASRVLASGPTYFADAQRIIHAILSRAYVIQAPGYWLFIRTAALFSLSETGLHIVNWTFSWLGTVTFFLLASELMKVKTAFLASLAYSLLFFNWLASDVQDRSRLSRSS